MLLPASLGLGYHPHWPHKNARLRGVVEGEFVKREKVCFSENSGKTPGRQSKRCSLGEREVAQSCPTLRDPIDCSLPGSSVHGIFQARVLEWSAIAFRKSGAAAPKFQRMLAFSQTSECDSSKIQMFSNHQVSVPYLVTNTGHVCVNK